MYDLNFKVYNFSFYYYYNFIVITRGEGKFKPGFLLERITQ